jgi:DNA-binding winged helix-turn-helix (wHTH) protein/TolB-like protein/Tfp pilus assembly protein PilF
MNHQKPLQGKGTDRSAPGGAVLHASTVWVGDWEADPRLNLLRRGSGSVHLEPKAMELLLFLARHPGQVLSRDELLAGVWPDLVVGDDALTQAVIKLRRALGDDTHEPSYVQTVPKRGYRLIAPVHAATATGDTASAARKRSRLDLRFVLAVAGLAAAALFLSRDDGPSITTPPPDAALVAATPLDARPTIVVLPFQPIGEDQEQTYLVRGLAADLSAALAGLSGLSVVASGSPLAAVRDGSSSARYRVWGGVRRTGERLVVEVRLTESTTGRQLWAERYDRPFLDIFAVQDEIGKRIAETLAVRVTEAEHLRLARRFSRSVDAYDLFLRAQQRLLVRAQPDNEQARSLYRRAVRLDPSFARAYGGLALTYAADYRNQWDDAGGAALRRALEMAQTAMQIDPSLAEVRWVMAYVRSQERRHAEALSHLDEALAISPSYADALALKGGIHTYIGDPAGTVPLIRNAMRLDLEAGYLYFLLLGRAYFFLDDLEQALINLGEAIARNPASLEAHVYLAATLARAGDQSGAEWEAEEIRAIEPGFASRDWLATYPMSDSEQQELLASLLAGLAL